MADGSLSGGGRGPGGLGGLQAEWLLGVLCRLLGLDLAVSGHCGKPNWEASWCRCGDCEPPTPRPVRWPAGGRWDSRELWVPTESWTGVLPWP